jgi:glycosyltransferase involved in cell wall biosynthesis
MKIAQFIDTKGLGGAETIMINLTKSLQERGCECLILHFHNNWIEKRCKEVSIPTLPLAFHKYYKSAKTLPVFMVYLAILIHKHRIDILHTHLVDPFIASFFCCFLPKVTHVGTFHDIYTVKNRKHVLPLLRFSVLLGGKVVTVSQEICDYILAESKNHINPHTIYNGIKTADFRLPSGMKLSKRQYLGCDDNDYLFICVSRLVELKNHITLIKAFSLFSCNEKVKLVIVGDGQLRGFLQGEIKRLNLSEKIMLLGEREDVPHLLNMSDCFVLLSTTEGLNCSIMEAMAAALPVIASDVGGNRELVKNELSGYLVNSFDLEEISGKMKLLASSPALSRKMGLNGRSDIERNFSLEKMYSKYLKLYFNAL